MKKKLLVAAVLMFMFTVFLPCALLAKTIELSLNLTIPPTHTRYTNGIKPWIEEIQKRTDGKVKITPYFAGAMSPPAENYDSVVSGLADLAEGLVGEHPGRFLLAEIGQLPEIDINLKRPGRVMWEIIKAFPQAQKEWAETRLLFRQSLDYEPIMTTKKPVRKLEDLKGLKIFVHGRRKADTGRMLGFSPVAMQMGDVYSALEKGVIDGAILPRELLEARKYWDLIKHVTRVSISHTTFYMVMNKDRYNSLPKDIQKILDEMSGDYAVDFFDKVNVGNSEHAEPIAVQKHGVTFIELSDSERQRWTDAVNPVWDRTAAELESKGLPGRSVLKKYRELIHQYSR